MLNSQPQRRNTSWLREDSHDITILRLHLPIGMSKECAQMSLALILVTGKSKLDFTSEIACSVFLVWNILSVMFKRLSVSQIRKDKRVNQPSANDG